ncbi:hypothetical protein [Streptomyces sp. NPDC002573]|uniref:hypothetical protein n=1 Tax=Streptomyces sp. NPDC002573 TaxID=3364651 RepID=UPI0036B2E95F
MTDRIPLDDLTSDQLDQLYDQLEVQAASLTLYAEQLPRAEEELAALRAVARGYCPDCGRGDAAPTLADWEQQKQRADQLAATLREVLVREVTEQPVAAEDYARWTAALNQFAPGPAATQATEADTCGHVIDGGFGRPLGPCLRPVGHREVFHRDANGTEWRPTRSAPTGGELRPA